MSERKIPAPCESAAAGTAPTHATELGKVRRDVEHESASPQSPSFDSKKGKGDDNPMEKRIEKLEDFAADAKERLVRIETRLDGIDERLSTTVATKADLAEAKFTVIVASISTMVALAGIVFAIARYFPAT